MSTVYTNIGTPLPNASRIIMLQNTTNNDVLISWDGITDHQFVPSGGFVLLDVTANKTISQQGWFVGALTQLHARFPAGSSAATEGAVYLTSFYGLVEGN
jgi:hypothetical protein